MVMSFPTILPLRWGSRHGWTRPWQGLSAMTWSLPMTTPMSIWVWMARPHRCCAVPGGVSAAWSSFPCPRDGVWVVSAWALRWGRAHDHGLAAAQGRGGFQRILWRCRKAQSQRCLKHRTGRSACCPCTGSGVIAPLQALARLGWQVPTPSMALYLWLPLPGWARERGWRDEQLTAALLEQTGLALTPGQGLVLVARTGCAWPLSGLLGAGGGRRPSGALLATAVLKRSGAAALAHWRQCSGQPPWRLRALPVCGSTETVLGDWLQDSPWRGAVPRAVVARRQTCGHGQWGRRWQSPLRGCLAECGLAMAWAGCRPWASGG